VPRRKRSFFRPAEEARCFLELLGVTGIAFTQPVLDVLGSGADVFIARDASRPVILAWTLLVTFGPAALLWSVELVVSLVSRRLRTGLHLVFLASVVGLTALELLKRVTSLGPLALVAAGAVAAVLVLVGLVRFPPLRLWARYLSIATITFAAVFLFASPLTDILRDRSGHIVDVAAARPAPVVLVVLDEFPLMSLLDGNGQIDRELYPNLARLAEESTWYRNSTTVASNTLAAVPAVFTGRYSPPDDRLPTVAGYPENLFTLLGTQYRLNVHERDTHLCPTRLCPRPRDDETSMRSLVGEAFDVWGHFASPRKSADPEGLFASPLGQGGEPPARYRRFIDSLRRDRPSEPPSLNVLHVLLPHATWDHIETGQRYNAPVGVGEGLVFRVWLDDAHAQAARQRHLLQVQYIDRMIGRTIARLKRQRMWDDALVVVTADHGVAFKGREPYRESNAANYPQLMWTPLFIKAPGQRVGETTDVQARSIDLLPTIADILDVKVPWKVDGHSLVDGPRPAARRLRLLAGPNDGYVERDARAGFEAVLDSGVPPGTGDPALRLYRLGARGDLVGTRVQALPRARPARFAARLDAPELFDDVDPRAELLPLYVSGAVDTKGEGQVVVSVNGVIGGWSQLHGKLRVIDGRIVAVHEFRTFFTVIPPSLLRPGRNDVELYLVEGEAGAETLTPLRLGGF
jgi:hypothetical protein